MKKMMILLALALSFAASAQIEDGLYYDEATGVLTLVVEGNELKADISDIKKEGNSIIVSSHYVYLLDSDGALIDTAKLGPQSEDAPPALTGNLEIDAANLRREAQSINIDFSKVNNRDYSKEKLFEIKGIPVYSSGLELNN